MFYLCPLQFRLIITWITFEVTCAVTYSAIFLMNHLPTPLKRKADTQRCSGSLQSATVLNKNEAFKFLKHQIGDIRKACRVPCLWIPVLWKSNTISNDEFCRTKWSFHDSYFPHHRIPDIKKPVNQQNGLICWRDLNVCIDNPSLNCDTLTSEYISNFLWHLEKVSSEILPSFLRKHTDTLRVHTLHNKRRWRGSDCSKKKQS